MRTSSASRSAMARDIVESHRSVEDFARLDGAVEHLRRQLVDVRPRGCDPTGEGDVAHERSETEGHILELGGADATDDAAVVHHCERGFDRG